MSSFNLSFDFPSASSPLSASLVNPIKSVNPLIKLPTNFPSCSNTGNSFIMTSLTLSKLAINRPRAATKTPTPVAIIALPNPLVLLVKPSVEDVAVLADVPNPLNEIFNCSVTFPMSLSWDRPCDRAKAPCTFRSAFSTSSDSPPNKAIAPCTAAIPPAAVEAAVVNA